MHRLNVGIGAIDLIQVPVVLQALRVLSARGIRRHYTDRSVVRATDTIVTILVDIVSQMDDDIDVLVVRKQTIGGIEAVALILTDDIADPKLRQMLLR